MACSRSPFRVLPSMAALLLASCAHTTGPAHEPPNVAAAREIGTVAPDVVDVRSLGEWRYGNRYGTYRVITRRGGIDRVQTAIIVEWLSQVMGEGSPAVVASRQVALLDDLGPITVAPAVYGKGPNQLTVSVEVKNTATGETGRVTSVAQAPGEMRTEYTKAKIGVNKY